ncbi:MAG TPA: hypothetical protein VFQ54_12495, partial [Thermomicrobiales bacterium]|nr:hypothetical protein [Thermomicrobiales bacterium]
VGHLAAALGQLWTHTWITHVGRDELAIRASMRTGIQFLGNNFATAVYPSPDLDDVIPATHPWELAVVAIPDQMRLPVMQRLLDDLAANMAVGGHMVLGGDSTEVTRMLALVKKQPAFRERDRLKRRGASVAIVERREG